MVYAVFDADLCNFSLLPGRRPAKIVKANIKPAVDVPVNGIILVADLLAGQALL